MKEPSAGLSVGGVTLILVATFVSISSFALGRVTKRFSDADKVVSPSRRRRGGGVLSEHSTGQ